MSVRIHFYGGENIDWETREWPAVPRVGEVVVLTPLTPRISKKTRQRGVVEHVTWAHDGSVALMLRKMAEDES